MFLSPQDIEDLTGYKRPSAQIRWLASRGYKVDVNGKGQPVVLKALVESKLGTAERRRVEPRFDRIGQEA
jgi:hypothetical protein